MRHLGDNSPSLTLHEPTLPDSIGYICFQLAQGMARSGDENIQFVPPSPDELATVDPCMAMTIVLSYIYIIDILCFIPAWP